MIRSFRHTAVAAALIAGLCSPIHAASIHGELVNGTTGEPIDGVVRVVNPSGGMMQEQEVKAVGGKFTIDGLDANVPMYLLRTDYAGATYSEVVQLAGQPTFHATLTVYEATTSWDDVHVIVPYLAVALQDGHMQVETMYEIHNHVEPAATIAGTEAQFQIYIPEDHTKIIRSSVSYHEVPLDRTPVKTDKPGVYRIDYPLRPGDTQVSIAYSVPYTDSAYALTFLASREIEEMKIYAINPNMDVTSSDIELGAAQSVHGMTAYAVTGLAPGTTFDITFKGGDPINSAPAGADPHAGGASPTVILQSNRMENPSILLMVAILLALVAVVGVGMRGATSPVDRYDQLSNYYDLMLRRMAKLDDLHGAGVVAPDVYAAKRAELKMQLAALKYRLQANAGSKKKRRKHREPQVAGNERTSTP
jgi:hypothetical protein